MKTNLIFLIVLLPITSGFAATSATPDQPENTGQTEEQNPAVILGEEVRNIADTTTISRKAQAKLITQAVRTAIISATEGIKDPAQRLKVASELATAATKAAPHFAATITSAISTIPSIAAIDGGLEQIQAAVSAGLESSEETSIANPASNPPRPPATPEFGGPNKSENIVSPSH